jgi:hypothetical protein
MKSINRCADCRQIVPDNEVCKCQQARAYVENLKPETTSEARSYFRAFWKGVEEKE